MYTLGIYSGHGGDGDKFGSHIDSSLIESLWVFNDDADNIS